MSVKLATNMRLFVENIAGFVKSNVAAIVIILAIVGGLVAVYIKIPKIDVKFCIVKLPASALPVIANAKGYFRTQGLNIQFTVVDLGKECIEKLAKGEVDVGIGYVSPAVRAIQANPKFKIYTSLHSSTNASAIIYKNSGVIHSPKDLTGKKIAMVEGTHSEFLWHLFSMASDIDDSEVQKIFTRLDQLEQMVESGQADAAIVWTPLFNFMSSDQKFKIFRTPFYTEFSLLVMSEEFAQKDQIAIRILAALKQAEIYYENNPRAARELVVQVLGGDLVNMPERLWESFKIDLGLSSVLKTMVGYEYLFFTNPEKFKLLTQEQRSYIQRYFSTEALKQVHPERVAF